MTARDVAAYLVMRSARTPRTLGVEAAGRVMEVARDVAMGSLDAALRDGEVSERHYAIVDQWIGAGEETGPQPKDVED